MTYSTAVLQYCSTAVHVEALRVGTGGERGATTTDFSNKMADKRPREGPGPTGPAPKRDKGEKGEKDGGLQKAGMAQRLCAFFRHVSLLWGVSGGDVPPAAKSKGRGKAKAPTTPPKHSRVGKEYQAWLSVVRLFARERASATASARFALSEGARCRT